MAQLQTNGIHPSKKKARNYQHAVLKVDMTPMVDLGFLLITFFIFTTTLASQKATDLVMPKEGPPIDLKESNALTLLLDSNEKVYVYEGAWKAGNNNSITHASFNDKETLRKLLTEKQAVLGSNKAQLMVLIKPATGSRYSNIIDALDEMLLTNVKRYAVVAPSETEVAYLMQQNQQQ